MVTRWLVSTSLVRFPTINWRSGVNGVNGAGAISHLFSFCVFTCSPGSWWFFRGKSTGKIHMVPVKNCVPKKIPGVFFCHIRISQKISHPTTSHNMIVSLYVSHYISLWKPLRIVYPIFSPWYQAFHQAVLDCMGFSNGPGPWNDHKKTTKKPTKWWSKMGNSHENHETYGKSYGKSYGNIIFQWGNPLFWCWKSIVQGHGLPWRCAAERIPSRYPLWPQRNGSLNHGFLGDIWGMELGKVCSARDMKWYETPMLLFGEPNS